MRLIEMLVARCYNARMNKTLKITKIGNSAGIILPKDVLSKLQAEVGDELFLTEGSDGLQLSTVDPEFVRQMQVAREIMRKDRDILRVLAQ
jgi:putative addiction module antidote